MAATSITPVALSYNALSTFTVGDALAADADIASSGVFGLVPTKADERLLLIFTNSHESAAYDIGIVKGNGYAAAAANLALADLTAGAMKAIVVESAKYAQMSGTNKGKIIVSGENAAIKVVAVKLP